MPFPSIALLSKRLHIRAVAEEHLQDLMAVNGDAEVTKFLPYETWRSDKDAESWLARMKSLEASGTGTQLVALCRATRQAVGTVLLFKLDESSQRAELGYVLGRSHWGKGLMTEALREVLGHAFKTIGLRRVEAEVNPNNVASNNLLLKLGFQHEGRARGRWVSKGSAYDTNLYGMLAADWQGAAEPFPEMDPRRHADPGLLDQTSAAHGPSPQCQPPSSL